MLECVVEDYTQSSHQRLKIDETILTDLVKFERELLTLESN